jgi:hypothetical protein
MILVSHGITGKLKFVVVRDVCVIKKYHFDRGKNLSLFDKLKLFKSSLLNFVSIGVISSYKRGHTKWYNNLLLCL